MAEGPMRAADIDLDLLRSGIRLMALRALGDPDVADDVTQETLSRAIEVLRAPETTANLGAYLAGIARHVIADYFRASARVVSIDQVDAGALHAAGPDPLAALCAEDELARVRHALAVLSDDDRELFRLCYVDGLTPTKIAERLGIPADRVRQRKLRALERLRVVFDGVRIDPHAGRVAPTINTGHPLAEGFGGTE
jgi:RNA polymerase sigma factor (sigma-70 family)